MNPNARADALLAQAEAELTEILNASGPDTIGAHASGVARMMWLAGYKTGMDAVKAMADKAIEQAQA